MDERVSNICGGTASVEVAHMYKEKGFVKLWWLIRELFDEVNTTEFCGSSLLR